MAFVLLWVGIAAVVGVPIVMLVSKVGSLHQLSNVARAHGVTLADSLAWSFAAGLAASLLAWLACGRAATSRSVAVFVFGLAAIAWVTPGPILGFGLKHAIDHALDVEDVVLNAVGWSPAFPPLRSLLYDQPSPLPAMWASVVRFFPVAVAFLWPAFRQVPRELRDLAHLDGNYFWQRRVLLWPLTRPSFVWALAATTALSLGELDAGKLVQTPGRQSFVQEFFNAMHYGPDATVAAMSLLHIAATCGVAGLLWITRRRLRCG
jgi:ABC-type Fe3+ transport system permease subunit